MAWMFSQMWDEMTQNCIIEGVNKSHFQQEPPPFPQIQKWLVEQFSHITLIPIT